MFQPTKYSSMFFLVLVTFLNACSSASSGFDADSQPSWKETEPALNDARDPIAIGDILDIAVYQVGELDRTLRVAENGTISMALIRQIQAAGKTAFELERELERLYGREYLQDPDISVFISERTAAGR
ncbi:MAG: polysaccharide biosynthesis/export family protein [Rhizobiaceae bacterium]